MSNQPNSSLIENAYHLARERYAGFGIDTDQAMQILSKISLSIHCWQGDDVGGFENPEGELTGGIAATGNYPGKARNPEELRQDPTYTIHDRPELFKTRARILPRQSGQSLASLCAW